VKINKLSRYKLILFMNQDTIYTIGIDLGGTNIKGLILDQKGEIIKQTHIPTKDTGDGTWRNNVKEAVEALKNEFPHPIMGIGLSAPGLPNADNSCIVFLPNRLAGLENFNWTDFLGNKTYVLNDAHSALMAEAAFGIAKGKKNVVLLTLGTGVGGGILINGQLYQGLSQMAGHLGHIVVDSESDTPSITGMVGSLEYAMGNYSVEKRSLGKFPSTWALVEAYRKGDTWATYVWLSSVRKLSLAIVSLSNAFSPDMIVLSGGITLAEDALFTPLSHFMDLYEWRPGGKQTTIAQAQFSDMAGAIGAAGFVFKKVEM
jgi:glucokinase